MNKMRVFKKSILAVTIGLASQQAFAAGFQLNAQSATGLGRAFAGDAVIADNASVMARNAAAMALFDKTAFSMGFESITSQIEVKDATYSVLGSSDQSANYDNAGDTTIAPNIHLIVPVNNKFAWGVDLYSNFGTKTDFGDSYTASEYGGFTEIKTLNLGLAGSYRVDEKWSFGAGLDIVYGYGKMKRTASSELQAYTPATLLNIDSDGFGLGFNVGAVYELDDKNRFGFSYHYQPDIKAKGDNTIQGTPYPNDEVTLKLPDMAEFSGYHRLNQEFAVHYSIQWIGWSEFDTLDSSSYGTVKTYDWQDGWHYAIGGTYYLNSTWTLRAGYMYDTSAQDQVTSISVPDSDRQWFSTGFTYHIDEESNVDFGFTYLLGKDVNVSESTTSGNTELSSLTAVSHANAILMGLQYSRTF